MGLRVPHETPHLRLKWLNVADVARRLSCTRWTAIRKIKAHAREMGADPVPFDNRKGARWRVNQEMFDEWCRARGIAA